MNFNPFIHYIGGTIDTTANLWYLWHAQTSMLTGAFENIFYTNLMCYPHGVSLTFDTFLFESIISLPIRLCCGTVAAYNFVILFTYIGTFIGMFLFLKLLSKNKNAAIVGALGFTFCTFRLQKTWAGHIDILQTEWLGFFLYFAYQAFFYRKKKVDIVGMAGMYILQAYTDYRTLAMLTFLMILVYIRAFIENLKENRFWEYIQKISLFAVISFSGLLPFLFLLRSAWTIEVPIPPSQLLVRMASKASHLLDFINPWEKMAQVYLGWLSLALSVSYLLFAQKKQQEEKCELAFWLIVFVASMLLCVGPTIQIQNGFAFHLPFLPYNWFINVPILKLFHIPSRFVVLMQIALSVFVAFSVKKILSFTFSRSISVLCVSALSIGIVMQNLLFVPFIWNVFSTDTLTEIIAHGSNGSVLAIPFGYFDAFRPERNWNNSYAMLQQIIFQKPLLGGYVSYIDNATYQWYQNQQFFQRIVKCQDGHQCTAFTNDEANEFIRLYDLKYILINNVQGIYSHMIPFFSQSFPDSSYYEEKDKYLFIINPDENKRNQK